MNKTVHREIVASELPAALRGDIDPSHTVRVVVEDLGDRRAERRAAAERILRYAGLSKHKHTTVEQAVAKIRQIRDEWDS